MSTVDYIFMLMPYYLAVIGVVTLFLFSKKTGKRFSGVQKLFYLLFFAPSILIGIVSLFILNPESGSGLEMMVRMVKIGGIITPFVADGVMTFIYS